MKSRILVSLARLIRAEAVDRGVGPGRLWDCIGQLVGLCIIEIILGVDLIPGIIEHPVISSPHSFLVNPDWVSSLFTIIVWRQISEIHPVRLIRFVWLLFQQQNLVSMALFG